MTPSRTPDWWTDVIRSRKSALDEYEKVLGLLDQLLTQDDDLSGSAVQRDARRWTELLIVADSAAQRLKATGRLVDARRCDALASGLMPPNSVSLEERAARASLVGKDLAARLKNRMSITRDELRRRRTRRPAASVYRNPTASHVNLFI